MSHEFSARSEFWQTLATALMLPRNESFFAAFRESLADDLEDLAAELDLDLGSALDDFSREALKLPDAETLLVTYSRLFLTPPIPCRLTIGWHLDSTLLGPSSKFLSELMAGYGVAQAEGLHETPDVLPTVLEFLSLMFNRLDSSAIDEERTAIEQDLSMLRTHYLAGAVRRMVELTIAGEDDYELAPVYSSLMKVIDAAIDDPLQRLFKPLVTDEKIRRSYASRRKGAHEEVLCKSCGKPIATERELHVIIHRLKEANLPVDHLKVCGDCRDAGMGWKSGTPHAVNIPGIR